MIRIDPQTSRPLFHSAAVRAIERQALAALPAHALMQRAGEAVARLTLALAPHARTIWVAAGPGNNGGDGLDAALRLRQAGKQVQVTHLGRAERLPADAADALARARAAGVAVHADLPREAPDVVIDALLGLGAARAPDGALAEAIRRQNGWAEAGTTILAVDVPSGLHPDTGAFLGAEAVQADHTLVLLALKPGLFTAHGRECSGEIWLDRLGIDATEAEPSAWLIGADHAGTGLARRRASAHKGSFGDVAVIGGAPGMVGAPLLAATAALASGAGRVYVGLVHQEALAVDPEHPELMFRPAETMDLKSMTVVCGCGGGDALRPMLPAVLSQAGRLVLDADALNAIANDDALKTLLRARTARRGPTVLTPHPLEAARLLGSSTAQVQQDRLAAARQLALRFQCITVLKGSGTVIAAPEQAPWINFTGNAALASPGTGDVLAGWIGGLLAQRSAAHPEPDLPTLGLDAACTAVYWHGLAADTWAAEQGRAQALPASALISRMQKLRTPVGALA